MKKTNKKPVDKEAKIGIGKFWAWQSRELSDVAIVFLVGYISLFCTDVIKVNPLIVGTVLMLTKIIDAITDVLAGYIVDRTNTKLGKGRPYDFCLIGTWVTLILLFACPTNIPNLAKIVWIAVFYTLSNAVFTTFLNAGENVFMLRAFNKKQIVRFAAFGGIVTSLGGLVIGIIIPQLINNAGSDPKAWIRAVATVGVPLALIGMCRFVFIRERTDIEFDNPNEENVQFKDILKMLRSNRFILLYYFISLISNIISNMGMMVYYAKWILGNLGIQSIFAAFSVLGVIALIILPKLMKRFSLKQILMAGLSVSIIANLTSFIAYTNVPVLVACYVINIIATVPGVYVVRIIMYDNADYNEYLGLHRMEGTMGAVNGFMGRVGAAIGVFLLGVILSVIGYDANAAAQTEFTIMGIRVSQYLLPVVTTTIQIFIWKAYTLESKLPEIHTELEQRKTENQK